MYFSTLYCIHHTVQCEWSSNSTLYMFCQLHSCMQIIHEVTYNNVFCYKSMPSINMNMNSLTTCPYKCVNEKYYFQAWGVLTVGVHVWTHELHVGWIDKLIVWSQSLIPGVYSRGHIGFSNETSILWGSWRMEGGKKHGDISQSASVRLAPVPADNNSSARPPQLAQKHCLHVLTC